ncbi:hypothetical protein JCM16303_000951 [Sporobolomyces ruberrimus]
MSNLAPFIPTAEMVPHLLDLRGKITGSKRFIISWLAVVWFDTLATLPDERLFWKSRWSALKVVFLLNRWISPCLQTLLAALVYATIPPAVCANIAWMQPASIVVIMFFAAILMAIRVYALYSTKVVLVVLAVMTFLEVAIMSAAASQFHPLLLPPYLGQITNLPGCIATGPHGRASALIAVFWAAPLTFDTIIVALTLYNILVIDKRAKNLPVLSNVLRDGMLFYVIISIANLVNVALYAQQDIAVQNFNNPTSTALTSIMVSRLVLSLRKVDTTQRSLQSRTSLSNLKAWSLPVPSPSPPFERSSPRSRQSSETLTAHRKSGELDEESGISKWNHVEMVPMGSSLHFPPDPPTSRRRRRSPNQAIVGLERLGLIAPSTATDISTPMALTPSRAPFSDVIPLPSPSTPPQGRPQSPGLDGRKKLPRGESREGGSSSFGITVERETVVSVAGRS